MAVLQLGDLLYADYIRNWALSWDGGDTFKGSFLLGSSTNNDTLPSMQLGDVLEVPFPIIDYSQYTDQDYKLGPLWTFDNSVEIYLAMRFTNAGGGIHYTYNANFQAWYNGGNIGLFNTGNLAPTGDFGQLAMISNGHGQGTPFTRNTTIAQGHNIKFFICTEYPADSVSGVTHPKRVSFNALFPFMYASGTYPDQEAIYQYYDEIYSGNNVNRNEWSWKYTSGGQHVSIVSASSPSIQWLDVLDTRLKQAHAFPSGGRDPWDDSQNPEDDPSGPSGGGGQYIQDSDPIDYPALPTGGPLTSGMLKAFELTATSIAAIQQKLWNMSIFDISTQFQKLLNEPLDCVVSLHAIPVAIASGNPEDVKLGSFNTEVQGNRITNNYLVVDCGTLNIVKMWGSALDYAPYTKDIDIFLPFIGFRTIKIEDAQASTLSIRYHVDILTGSCVAFIKCGGSVLYTFTGNCIQHIPVSGSSSDLLKNTIFSTAGLGAAAVTMGNPAGVVGGTIAAATNVATSKNYVQRTGEVAGTAGLLGEFKPYVIIHRPEQSLAKNYNRFKGYPSNITYKLSALTGYTEVEHVHLTGISGATDGELAEIKSLLTEGVII